MSDVRETVMRIAQRIAADVCLHVAEIPDRNSPDDQPEMMLVTREELAMAVICAFVTWYDEKTPRSVATKESGQ